MSTPPPFRLASTPSVLAAILLLLSPPILQGQDERQQWTLRPDLRIGSINAPNYSLTSVAELAVGPTGTIYVGQNMEKLIRVFDRNGKFLKTVGGEGFGPGEFQSVTGLGLNGERLWVSDLVMSRISLFGSDGELISTVGFRGPMLEISSRPTHPHSVFADGTLLGVPSTGSRRGIEAVPILRMNHSGEILTVIGKISATGRKALIRTDKISLNAKLPVASNSLWEISSVDSSVVIVHRPIAESGDVGFFQLHKLGALGDTIFDRRYRYTPNPISDGSVDVISRFSKAIDMMSRTLDRSYVVQLLRDSIPVPPYEPPVSAMTVGRDGTIWLRREGLGKETVEWLVLDRQGLIVSEVSAPANLQIMEAERDQVWGVIEDELEIPYIVRYKVIRSGAAN